MVVVAAGGLAAAYWFGPQLLDEFRAQQYTPSSQISAIEQRVTLTSAGKRIFHATSPEVQDSEQFNSSCHSVERTTAILGCYYRDRIYLYNVQNNELDGALDVTAAHEPVKAAEPLVQSCACSGVHEDLLYRIGHLFRRCLLISDN